jgi:hypothetical protein
MGFMSLSSQNKFIIECIDGKLIIKVFNTNQQMHLVAEEVMPKLGEKMDRRPLPNLQPLV